MEPTGGKPRRTVDRGDMSLTATVDPCHFLFNFLLLLLDRVATGFALACDPNHYHMALPPRAKNQ